MAARDRAASDHAGRSAGRLRLDSRSRTAITDGQPVPLTATEFALLGALMDHAGRVLSRRQLLAAAGRETAGDRAADVYVAQLRAKIGSAASHQDRPRRRLRALDNPVPSIQGGQ